MNKFIVPLALSRPTTPQDLFFKRMSTLGGKSFKGEMVAGNESDAVFATAMFIRESRSVSNTNVWAFEVDPGQKLGYQLKRSGRLLLFSFDLIEPIAGVSG